MIRQRKLNLDSTNVLLICVFWSVSIALVNPLGDFPLNDDWVYGLSVKALLEEGNFRLPAHASSNFFSQAFWGALFCFIPGFSFTLLRFSTLFLGAVGVLMTYAILRLMKATPGLALLGALLVQFNPIYFGLANSFMTDVPFYSLFVISLYFIIFGFKNKSNLSLLTGILVSCVALLIRQIDLLIPAAFGITYIVQKGFTIKNLLKGFLPTFSGIAIHILYSKWLILTGRIPELDNPQYRWFLNSFLNNVPISLVRFNGKVLITLFYGWNVYFSFYVIYITI